MEAFELIVSALSTQSWHSLSRVLPLTGENLPGLHSVQVSGDVASITPEYLPGSQLVHVGAPLTAENFPAPQIMHSVKPEVPLDDLPAGQAAHLSAPEKAPNFPATQG